MKYKITLSQTGRWHQLHTDFVITKSLANLIDSCKGVSVFDNDNNMQKYYIEFGIGELFEVESVLAEISSIVNDYILSSQNDNDIEMLPSIYSLEDRKVIWKFCK